MMQNRERSIIPYFYGIDDRHGCLEWVKQMDRVFDDEYYSERQKIRLALSKFRGDALHWWDHLYNTRERTGEPHVASWFELKYFMKEEFVSCNYRSKPMSQQEYRQRRPSPHQSYEMEVPKRRNKHEHVMQKLKSTISEVLNEFATKYDFMRVSSQAGSISSSDYDGLTCFEPEKPSSFVSESQVDEENAAADEQSSIEISSNPQEQTSSPQDDVTEPNITPPSSISHQQESENCFPQTSKQPTRGKYLESKQRMKPDLLSLGAEHTILRSTLCKEWDYNEPTRKHSAVASCPENSFDVGAFKEAYLSNQEEVDNEAGCFGKLIHQSSFTKWFHHNDMSEQKVMDFTNRTNLTVRDQDMYAFQDAFRANQRESKGEPTCSRLLTHQGITPNKFGRKRNTELRDMDPTRQVILHLPDFQTSRFETLQSYIWRPGEFSKLLFYKFKDSLSFKYTDMSRLPLSKASNAGVGKGVQRTRRLYKREEDGRFKPPDLGRDMHQEINYFMLEREEPPDLNLKPEPNEDLRANLFKGGGDDAIRTRHPAKMELIGLIYEVLDREKQDLIWVLIFQKNQLGLINQSGLILLWVLFGFLDLGFYLNLGLISSPILGRRPRNLGPFWTRISPP